MSNETHFHICVFYKKKKKEKIVFVPSVIYDFFTEGVVT